MPQTLNMTSVAILANKDGLKMASSMGLVETATDSILQAHPQDPQLSREGIPAFGGLGRGFDGRLNGLRALFFSRFDQPEFMSSVCFGPFEGGDEFGMGGGWIHGDLIV